MKINTRFHCPYYLIFLLFAAGCQTSSTEEPAVYPIELKWVRHSIEYQSMCLQTYQAAWKAVKARSATLSRDWAVVLDVDETALDNSRYQEILYEKSEAFPFYWDGWVMEENCPPVPGVKAFIDSVPGFRRQCSCRLYYK